MPSFNSLILFYSDTSGRLLRERIRKTTANMEKYSYRKSRERWNSAEKTRQRRAVKIKPQISVTDIACERSGAGAAKKPLSAETYFCYSHSPLPLT